MSRFIENNGTKIIPALIFFILLIIFLVPFTRSIVNLGNCAGAAVSAVLTAIFVFFRPFSLFIKQIWEKPAGKVFVCAISAIIVIFTALAVVISVFMLRAANDSPKGRDTTLVILGCKVKNGAPSLMLKKRLDAAAGYLSANEDVCVIVSGGQGSDEIISEAQCMRDYLVSCGIAPDRIYMEDKSANTEENLSFSKEIIEREKLCGKITIVSDGYHQLRAEMIAEGLGMEAYNISADTSWWLIPTYWVREWFGVVHYKLFS